MGAGSAGIFLLTPWKFRFILLLNGDAMDETEYNKKFSNLRILKSIQEYFKSDKDASTSVYPIRVPDELLLQSLKIQGAENADELINYVFKLGLTIWSEKLYQDEFGTTSALCSFIDLVKSRNNKLRK
jgi:hypothetical protein